ncbi:MAG: ATPase, T2SS/T4P/T4SS family [Patescibacteria group bacterium]
MSKIIISNLFNYAHSENAKGFTIENTPTNISLNYHFHDEEARSFNLPKKLEKDLSLALRQILKLAPDELTSKKYCKIEDKNFKLNFHLTIVPSSHGEKIIISIISKNNNLLSLRQLGMQANNLKLTQKFLKKSSGLILISSPDNNGKNTSMFACLKELITLNRSSYLISNKPKYNLDGLNNLEKNKNNWAKVLTIDSEIIATEINDTDDFKNVILAANSGRLVIATIKANSVWEVMLKYLKVKTPLKLKLENLKLIINQRVTPLKRLKSNKSNETKNARGEIGLFEVLEISSNLKKFLIDTEEDKVKENFWDKIGKIAIKDGYEAMIIDHGKKLKDGLIEK